MLTSAPRSGHLSTASVAEATRCRSPGVSSAAFRAQSPNLRFAHLMDMDFAVSCPLVRRWRLISGFCSSTRTFDPCFLQTPPRGGSPCIITRPSPPSGWSEDFHLHAAEHARHTTKPPAAADATRGHAQNIFLSQHNGSSIAPVMIGKPPIAKLVFVQVEELLSTQGVRLLSP